MTYERDTREFLENLGMCAAWLSTQTTSIIERGRSDLSKDQLKSAREFTQRIDRAITMIEASERLSSQNSSIVDSWELNSATSHEPLVKEKENNALHKSAKGTVRKKRRPPDHCFDFLILEIVRFCESKGMLCSKEIILAALKIYNPDTSESALGPKLNTWNCNGSGKGWLDWTALDTSSISITSEGRDQRSKLRQISKQRAQARIERAIRETVDENYVFPDG